MLAAVLLLAAGALTFGLAGSVDVVETYESSAVVKVASKAILQDNLDYLVSLDQSVESGDFLSRIITTYSLYPRMPMEDVIEVMKKSIRIEPLPKDSKNATAFVVRFVYTDPLIAQKVTDELVARFLQESLGDPSATLSVLDRASLPRHRHFPVGPRFLSFLLLGIVLAVIAALFQRSRAPV